MSELINQEWSQTTIKASSYLKGRIGWQGLRANEFIDHGPYLVTGTDFQNGSIDWNSCYHVSEARFQEGAYIHVRNGDLLITKDGTIGKVAYVTSCPAKAVLNSGIFLLRCADGSYDHRFLYHLLRSNLLANFLRLNLAGSTINHLYQNVFERFCFPTPKLEVQRSITAVLDTVDEAIAKADAVIAKLKQIRAALLHDLLTRGLDAHGQLRDPLAHPEQLQDTSLGSFPLEWDMKSLDALCTYIGSGVTPRGGQDVYTATGVMLIRSQNVTFAGLLLDDVAFIPEDIHLRMLRSEVHAHDVLFNITGASIGRCCPMPEGLSTANVNQHVCALRLPDANAHDAAYLASVLASSIGQKQLEVLNTMGNRQGINYQQLGSFLIPWPGPDERQHISESIWSMTARIRTEERERDKLAALKSGLMTDLLTGRVRVPANFESASPCP